MPPSHSRPVVTPLWPSVVYRTTDADELDRLYDGEFDGYTYAREGHPNAEVVATKIDQLEGLGPDAPAGLITGSGMAALSVALFGLLNAGDHVIADHQLYGGTRRLLDDATRLGIGVTLTDLGDSAAMADAVTPATRMVLAESVSNPTLRIPDIEAVAALAGEHDLTMVVDNTFTTPRMFRPFDHGAHVVVHSVTKLLAGHADVTLGYVAATDPQQAATMRTLSGTLGVTASPFDCWLAERGLHSFDLRYDRAEASAARLATELSAAGGVESVLYPGHHDHPDHDRAAKLFGSRGGTLVSFTLQGGRAAANAFAHAAPQIPFAPTLGDVATIVSHPASSSHRKLSPEQRLAIGITEGMLRVSVGIEEPDLVINEIVTAVAKAAASA